MTARLKGRRREVAQLVRNLSEWAGDVQDVRALAVVGSYAYGRPRIGSDLDLVVLTIDPARYGPWLASAAPFAPSRFLRMRTWGAVSEVRLRRPSGLHLDIGVTTPQWLAGPPLDAGTSRVLGDGFQVLYDPDGLFARAVSPRRT